MRYDLTLAKIRNTDFASLYDRFIVGEKLSQKQYEILLAIAICFTNADDTNVQQLGYRIVVEYCNHTNDYFLNCHNKHFFEESFFDNLCMLLPNLYCFHMFRHGMEKGC